jgi:hypothetical protein
MIRDHREPNRPPATLAQLLNPLWWAGDEDRPSFSWSWLQWFLRNPFANFLAVIVGIAHCSRSQWYTRSAWTYAENGGLNAGWSVADCGFIPRPFVSYRASRFEFMVGWKTSGCLSLGQFRRAKSPNAGLNP